MLLVAIFRTAHKPLTLWQSMSLFIGWDLSGHLTRRCSSNSYRQTFQITSHRITASASFLEHLIRFMSVAFGGCNFVATFLCNLWLFTLRWYKRSRVFVILTGISRSKIIGPVRISGAPFPRWRIGVRISAFQAAVIKYGNIPGWCHAC